MSIILVWLEAANAHPRPLWNLAMTGGTCYVHGMYTKGVARAKSLRHKHLKLDQRKIDFAKRYFHVDSEQEAIERALSLLMDEEQIIDGMAPLRGALKRDKGLWPYL